MASKIRRGFVGADTDFDDAFNDVKAITESLGMQTKYGVQGA